MLVVVLVKVNGSSYRRGQVGRIPGLVIGIHCGPETRWGQQRCNDLYSMCVLRAKSNQRSLSRLPFEYVKVAQTLCRGAHDLKVQNTSNRRKTLHLISFILFLDQRVCEWGGLGSLNMHYCVWKNTPCSIFDSFLNNLGYLLHALHPSTHTHSLDRTDSALACSVLSTPLSRTLILEPSRFYPLVNSRAKACLSVRVVGLAYISWFLGRAHVVGACRDPGYPGGESEKKNSFPLLRRAEIRQKICQLLWHCVVHHVEAAVLVPMHHGPVPLPGSSSWRGKDLWHSSHRVVYQFGRYSTQKFPTSNGAWTGGRVVFLNCAPVQRG